METKPPGWVQAQAPSPRLHTSYPLLVPLRRTEIYLTPCTPVHRATVYRKDLVSQLQGEKLQLLQLAGSAKQVTLEVLIQDLNELWWDIDLRQDATLNVLLIYHTEEDSIRLEGGGVGRNSYLCPNSQTTMVPVGYEKQWQDHAHGK